MGKPVKVINAEITDDGALIVEFNQAVAFPSTRKIIFMPDALELVADECAEIPPRESNDFPGVPVVRAEDIDEEYKKED